MTISSVRTAVRRVAMAAVLVSGALASAQVPPTVPATPSIARVSASPPGTSALSGVVRDTIGFPIPYATVFVVDGDGEVASDSGTFLLDGVPPGKTLFGVRRLGYGPVYFEIDMPAEATVHVSIKMRPVVRRLREVTVEEKMQNMTLARAGFYERQKAGWGTFLLLEEIQSRRPRDLAALFYDINGVYLEQSTGVAIPMGLDGTGTCPLNIYVDGVRIRSNQTGLDQFPPTTIKAIEIYARLSETPPQFRRADARCGSVVLWTRID